MRHLKLTPCDIDTQIVRVTKHRGVFKVKFPKKRKFDFTKTNLWISRKQLFGRNKTEFSDKLHLLELTNTKQVGSNCRPNQLSHIYPSELQRNKANTSDTEVAFLDLQLCISNDIVSTKMYDKRNDFDFEIVNFPFLEGDVPRSTSYGVCISQLIRFARASSYITDFKTRK